MKKKYIWVIVVIAICILLWGSYILFDSIRLKKSDIYTYPIIKLSQKIEDNTITYIGLGYTISYNTYKEQLVQKPGLSAIGYGEVKVEFKLFGKILLWSYERDFFD